MRQGLLFFFFPFLRCWRKRVSFTLLGEAAAAAKARCDGPEFRSLFSFPFLKSLGNARYCAVAISVAAVVAVTVYLVTWLAAWSSVSVIQGDQHPGEEARGIG